MRYETPNWLPLLVPPRRLHKDRDHRLHDVRELDGWKKICCCWSLVIESTIVLQWGRQEMRERRVREKLESRRRVPMPASGVMRWLVESFDLVEVEGRTANGRPRTVLSLKGRGSSWGMVVRGERRRNQSLFCRNGMSRFSLVHQAWRRKGGKGGERAGRRRPVFVQVRINSGKAATCFAIESEKRVLTERLKPCSRGTPRSVHMLIDPVEGLILTCSITSEVEKAEFGDKSSSWEPNPVE